MEKLIIKEKYDLLKDSVTKNYARNYYLAVLNNKGNIIKDIFPYSNSLIKEEIITIFSNIKNDSFNNIKQQKLIFDIELKEIQDLLFKDNILNIEGFTLKNNKFHYVYNEQSKTLEVSENNVFSILNEKYGFDKNSAFVLCKYLYMQKFNVIVLHGKFTYYKDDYAFSSMTNIKSKNSISLIFLNLFNFLKNRYIKFKKRYLLMRMLKKGKKYWTDKYIKLTPEERSKLFGNEIPDYKLEAEQSNLEDEDNNITF